MTKQQYLTPEAVAEFLSIKRSLLANWRVSGQGPAYVKLGAGKRALVRYPLHGANGIVHFMECRTRTSTSDIQDKKHAGKQIDLRYL